MIVFRIKAWWLIMPFFLSSAAGADVQDFADTQRLNNHILFPRAVAVAEKQEAEDRRVRELDLRSHQQAVVLQQQALAVQQLASNLQSEKEERRLIDLAGTFDTAVVGGQWQIVRSLLADDILVDLAAPPFPAETRLPADAFTSQLSVGLAKSVLLPRSNQRAMVDTDHATLTSDGFAWTRQGQPRGRPGQFEYRFTRRSQDWLVEAVVFHPSELR